ncbi:retrovirus-related pol polyprotein from transposon TNT 1-94 [Tanacetum coccineum]
MKKSREREWEVASGERKCKRKCFELSDNILSESENQSDNECQMVAKGCDNLENSKVIALGISHASYDVNDLFVFDDVSIRNFQVSKMPFRKKPCDSLNVHSKNSLNNSLPRLSRFIFGSSIRDVQSIWRGLEVTFRKSACFVRNKDGVDLLTGDHSSNLYTIALNEIASNSSACLLAKASCSQSWLWHQHLSHLNFTTINNLVKNNLVRGLHKLKFEKDHLCSACENGKIHQKHHKSKTAFASNKPLYLLHIGFGVERFRVAEISKRQAYMCIFVDENSRGVHKVFETDNGTEFKNKTLAKFFDEYFDASKILKSPTTNVETSNEEISLSEEVFHESSESFQEESSSSSLNADVQQSSEEVEVPLSNTQSHSNNMVPNVDDASTSYNVFNERLEDAYFDASTTFHDLSNVHTFYQPYPHEKKWTKDHPLLKIIGDPMSSVCTVTPPNRVPSDLASGGVTLLNISKYKA